MNMHAAPHDDLRLRGLGPAAMIGGGLVGLAGLAATVGIDGISGSTIFWKSWLFGFMLTQAICLGALFFVILQHATKAGWSVTVRRPAEAIAANLQWTWLLFVPILVLVWSGKGAVLFQWCDAQYMHSDHVLEGKLGYLNPTFWSIRAIVYLGVWALLARFYRSQSIAQDSSGDLSHTMRMQWWAPISIVLYGLTQTFASIDWIMAIQPKWFSTMFGVYWFAVSCTGFFATAIVLLSILRGCGYGAGSFSREHFHDLGKLLFAFGVVFWAYIGYSQYMLIWYANIPIETEWFVPRQLGPWFFVSWILILGHFALPFVLLITRWTKRFRNVLVMIAIWMVAMFIVDVYWLLMPMVPEEALAHAESWAQLQSEVSAGTLDLGWNLSILNFTALIGAFGLLVCGTFFFLGRASLAPTSDPRLSEALAFENF
ncbi:MAG: hypothetical protein MK100_06300 [Phycisphaerales bacterium]|nr:hypothetical protein [Phycisphaerales bacterium]